MLSRITSPSSNRILSKRRRRECWTWLGTVSLITLSLVLLVWNEAKTADIKQPNHSSAAITGSSTESARYRPGEVIVKFHDGASAVTIAAAHTELGAHTMKSFSAGIHRLHQLKLGKGVAVEDAITKYRQHPAVEYAEPNYIYQFAGSPNDPLFSQLWGLHNTGQTVRGVAGIPGADIHAAEAWDITTGSPNVIIAVIDTGIAYNHPDLTPNMWTNPGETPNDGIDNDGNGYIDDYYGYDFFNNDSDPMDVVHLPTGILGHGTGLSGTMAAVGNNSLGVTGVMHSAKLMALKAGSGLSFVVTTAAFIPAGTYAIAKGARVINASFGRLGGACSAAEYGMLSAANAAGIMVLAAAGNKAQDNDIVPWFPAQYSVATACGPALPNVIAVAASDQFDNLASFSSFGAASVQVASPGTDETYSTYPTPNVTNILLHNFDSNPAGLGYTFSGINNSWGFTNAVSLSSPSSLTDSPTANYLDNSNSFATGPVFSTVGQHGCLLTGAVRLASASNNDGILIQASGDGGVTWTSGNKFSSSTGGQFLNLPLAEVRDGSLTDRFRINLFSDASGNADGAYLDDLRVNCVSGAPSGNTDYGFVGGTSSATAHVTGVVGLLLSVNPNLTVAQLRNAIVNTGDVLPDLVGKTLTGRRLNAFNALNSIASTFTVMVAKNGTGTGTVASTPVGINCGGDCNEQFPGGTTVTLTATPSAGSVFTGWSGGGCNGTGACIVSTTATVTAIFNLPAPSPFTVTVNKNGTGTGTVTSNPAGITCGVDCTGTYPGETKVTLTATADAGSVFTGWNGGGCAGAGTCVASTTATVTATFSVVPQPIIVTVNKNGTGAGTVTSNPAGINCGGDCTETYPGGTTVTLTSSPAAGSLFAGWSGGCTGTGICQVASTVTVTATFNVLPPPGSFTVTILKGGTGTGKVVSAPTGIECGATCSFNFLQGTTVTLTASPDAGSTFTGWSGSGCAATSTCLVNTAATVTATFDALVPSSGGGGGCTIAQAGSSDAVMPTLLLVTLGALIWRVRRRSN